VGLKNLGPCAERLSRGATQALVRQARELRSLLEVDPALGEGLLHVRREVGYKKILSEEDVQ